MDCLQADLVQWVTSADTGNSIRPQSSQCIKSKLIALSLPSVWPGSDPGVQPACKQARNHVFKVGGPIPWSRVLLPFYRKKLDRFTQFGGVGYTLFIRKLCKKLRGFVQILGGPDPPDPPVVASMPASDFLSHWTMFCQINTILTGSLWHNV